MGWLAIQHHRIGISIHRLSTIVNIWAPSSACSISTQCLASYGNTRHYHPTHSNRQITLSHVFDSPKTFSSSVPLGFSSQCIPSGLRSISSLYHIPKLHQVNFSRSLHQSSSNLCTAKTNTDSDFKEVIYRFPFIRVFRLINRLKIVQTLLVTVLVPGVIYLHHLKLVGISTVISQSCFAVFAMVMLYAISYYMRRVIGILYINEAQDKLKIAHMTFWGKRHDEVIPVTKVVPFKESGDKPGERFMHLKLYDSDQYYILDRKRGQFVNLEAMEEVFGEFH